jgi:hypothetical protein
VGLLQEGQAVVKATEPLSTVLTTLQLDHV